MTIHVSKQSSRGGVRPGTTKTAGKSAPVTLNSAKAIAPSASSHGVDGENWKVVALNLVSKIDRLLRELTARERTRGRNRSR